MNRSDYSASGALEYPAADTLRLAVGIADDMIEALPHLRADNLSLGSGLTGQAVFFSHLAQRCNPGNRYSKAAQECLSNVVTRIRQADAVQPGLFSGAAGIAWGVREAYRLIDGLDVSAKLDLGDVYDFVLSYVSESTDCEFDLVAGLAGIGIWALTLPEQDWRQRLSSCVVRRLADCAVREAGHIKWQTPECRPRHPTYSPPSIAPEFNLGVAHGVPGVIGFLATCLARHVETDLAGQLLSASVSWLLSQELPHDESECSFSYVADSSRVSRLAWCYGDAAVAAVLHSAANALNNHALSETAHRIILRAAKRRGTASGVRDAGICHGAAGLAHIFSGLAQRTHSSALYEAHRYWRHQIVAMQTPGEGIGGYRAYQSDPTPRLVALPGLLGGASGIALVLLSDTSGDVGWAYPFLTQ